MSGCYFSHEIHRFPRNTLFSWWSHINLIKSKFHSEKTNDTQNQKKIIDENIWSKRKEENVLPISIKPFVKIDIRISCKCFYVALIICDDIEKLLQMIVIVLNSAIVH